MRAWLYRPPGLYQCQRCEANLLEWKLNGRCGGIAGGPLRLLVGESETCPTALGLDVPDILKLASVVEGPGGDPLGGINPLTLPTRYRIARTMAQWWAREYREAIAPEATRDGGK